MCRKLQLMIFLVSVFSILCVENNIGSDGLVEPVSGGDIQKLQIQPPSLVFSRPGEIRRIVVTGHTKNGERLDLSASFEIKLDGNIVKKNQNGSLQAIKQGQTELVVSVEGKTAILPIEINGSSSKAKTTFLRDVMPVINKVGCTNGVCHGAAKGKNGFKLSLRGYDPEFDYQSLLYDMSSRRFNRADPSQSLMLAKPTQQLAHEGGMRLKLGSLYYNQILNWIAEGVPFGDSENDRVEKLKVFPKDIFMHGPGRTQQVVVIAYFGDGSTRDVTGEAHFGSSNGDAVAVDNSIVRGIRKGESTLMVRYEGKFVMVPVTVLNPKTGFAWVSLPQYNYIDELVDSKLERLKIQPSPISDDAEFLRRVTLDLTGRLPELEAIKSFLSDSRETRTKRSEMISRLIQSEAYADYWTLKWGDLLRSNRKFMSYKGMWTFREWLRESILENKPYDVLVRELLTATGSTFENPAANFFLAARDPKAAMEATTQLFLGIRMVCAQCHDHPFEKWTQDQYYQMAAFFSAIGIRPGFESGEEVIYRKRTENKMRHPKDGRLINPKFLVTSLENSGTSGEGNERRNLVTWLTSKNNPFFARAIVNRIWSYFFHRGIINPVDDIRTSNPAINESLLDALAKDFKDHNFDLQQLMKTITNSRVYQTTFRTNEWNNDDTLNFSHQIPRRLGAESLADAIGLATGSKFKLPEMPDDYSPIQIPDPHVGKGGFLDLFGRPQREEPCECERRSEVSLPHALNLLNGPILANAIADPNGRIAKLILEGKSHEQLVENLYLSTLSRSPTPKESNLALGHLASVESQAEGAQDVLWALLNSNGFLFNQ